MIQHLHFKVSHHTHLPDEGTKAQAGIVACRMKLPPAMSESIRMLVWVPAPLLWMQLTDNTPGKSAEAGPSTGCLLQAKQTLMETRLLALAQPPALMAMWGVNQ